MSLVRRALFGLTLLATVSPALAEDTFPERTIDGWRVYGWDDDCWMTRPAQADGTQVLLSTGDDDHDLYVVVRNEKWTSITSKKSYTVRVRFDSVDIEKSASPSFDDERRGVALFVSGRDQSFVPNLRRSKEIELSVGGAVITRIPLADSAAALDYFERCGVAIRALAAKDKQAYERLVRDAIGRSGGAAPQPAGDDPFSGRDGPAGRGPVAPSSGAGAASRPGDPFGGKEETPEPAVPSIAPRSEHR